MGLPDDRSDQFEEIKQVLSALKEGYGISDQRASAVIADRRFVRVRIIASELGSAIADLQPQITCHENETS